MYIVFIEAAKPMDAMTEAALATKIIEAASQGFTSTASLARRLQVGRDQVVGTYDVIEAAGYRMMRIRGIGGGIEILGRPAALEREAA